MDHRSLLNAIPLSSTLFASFVLLLMTITANAQMPPDTNLFQWKFSDNASFCPQLPSCQSFGITVEPVNATNVTHGIPPFYMIAWEIDGTPRTTLLGLNESSLSWTVDHPVGASLMLNVVDSQGNGGGVPPQAYTVQSGQSTECIVNSNQSDFTVSANITGTVNTCQPYGLRIHGGVPPYNISLAQFNSPVVTNVTISSPNDAFTYINRATPGYLLLAAVSDITGRYAFGTPIIMPRGSEDVSCVGLNSSPGNTVLLNEEQDAQADAIAKAKRRQIATLAGILTPLSILIFGSAFIAYRYHIKQERLKKELAPEPLVLPEPKVVEEAGAGVLVGSSAVLENQPSLNPFLTEAERTRVALNDTSDLASSTSRRGFVNFPTSSIHHSSKKAIEAGRTSSNLVSTDLTESTPAPRNPFAFERSLSAQPRSAPPSSVPTRSASFPSPMITPPAGDPEYLFQHQDGGRFVRELPPPYERHSRQIPDVPQSP
ncbi:hypothetical protein F5876DRAFT_76120 [Lentinula aff. lateritia]|uniref:Uncharacterized protein n=1 Tax=Lentinula aff. lateritia TaxID=2804960 RepID=A0ACC1U235_9AGAR|nr:hypothetical protein F5876DRAFT_76120 [Lentinula aff. lateritia]